MFTSTCLLVILSNNVSSHCDNPGPDVDNVSPIPSFDTYLDTSTSSCSLLFISYSLSPIKSIHLTLDILPLPYLDTNAPSSILTKPISTCLLVSHILNTHKMITTSKVGIVSPKLNDFTIHGVSLLLESQSFKKALEIPKWYKVVQVELDILLSNET